MQGGVREPFPHAVSDGVCARRKQASVKHVLLGICGMGRKPSLQVAPVVGVQLVLNDLLCRDQPLQVFLHVFVLHEFSLGVKKCGIGD